MTKLSDAFDQLDAGSEPRGAASVLSAATRTARVHRRRRRTAVGLVGTAALVIVAVAAWPSSAEPDDEVDVGGVTSTTTSTTSSTSSTSTTTSTTEPAPVVPPVVDPEATSSGLLLYGEDGISTLIDGEERQLWSEPVVAAFDDGAGGVVFQDLVGLHGAIRWLPAGSDVPVELVPDADHPQLRGVRSGGSPEVLFTRVNQADGVHDPTAVPEDREERLFARVLATGDERELGITGGYDSGLDALATSDAGLLVSTCHLQCRVWVLGGPDDGREVRLADWIAGLDVEGDVMAFVREDPEAREGPSVAGELVLERIGGEEVAVVALPPQITVQWRVDLSADRSRAIVSLVDYSTGLRGPEGALLVEGIGTSDPTVRLLGSDGSVGGARFLDVQAEAPEIVSLTTDGIGSLRFDDPRRESEVDAYLREVVGPWEEDTGWVDECVPDERRISWTHGSVNLQRRDGLVHLVSWTATAVLDEGPQLAAPFAPGTTSAEAEALGAAWNEAYAYWELDGYAGAVDDPGPGPAPPPGSTISRVHAGVWLC